MEIIKKLGKYGYYVFLAALVAVALAVVISAFPIQGNIQIKVGLSGSMEPGIKVGSVVVVKPSENYKIGDVITFGEISKIKTPTTHRIYEIKMQGSQPVYITKGDANDAPDQREITGKEIIGKVLFSVPYAGYVVDTAKKPYGFALIIIVPATLIIFGEIKKIYEEVVKRKNNKNKD